MGLAAPSPGEWSGRRVLVTGHTGFVGGWLCAWLEKLGARVSGYALPPVGERPLYGALGLAGRLERSVLADLRDAAALRACVQACDPEVVLHLAAQPIVREGYRDPVATFDVNVMGTVRLLEACRAAPSLRAAVVYTTDKVYRNDDSGRPFVEDDPLGGNEPYGASKAAADCAAAAYRASYYLRDAAPRGLAVVRAGNIVGGGDWAPERLLPDAIRAFARGAPVVLRHPAATRPWQHVIDAVRGTLLVAEHAVRHAQEAGAWNLGPAAGDVHPVSAVVEEAARAWGAGAAWKVQPDASIPESRALVLSSEKAARLLGWRCAWDMPRAVGAAVAWYRAALEGREEPFALTLRQIDEHLEGAA